VKHLRQGRLPLASYAPLVAVFGCIQLGTSQLGCTPMGTKTAETASESRSPSSETTNAPPNAAPDPGQSAEPVGAPPELSEVSRLRGLPAKAPLALRRISRDELKAHLERSFDAHMPERAILGTEVMLESLGVVPAGFRYRDTVIQLMQSELAGLYDPAENTMFLLADLSKEMEKATLEHELVHALQDQHYSLDRITVFREDESDALSALSSLAEGDATSLMFDAALASENKTALDVPISILERQLSLASTRPETAGVPRVLVRALLAPYIDGMRFVQRLRERGGFAAVDRAWQSPPTTTEQLLHEDRYAKKEHPVAVAVPPSPAEGGPWQETLHDVWGEQSWRVVLEEFTTGALAQKAAEGWGGDRVVAYTSGPESAFAAVIVMDSEADAAEFEQALLARDAAASSAVRRPAVVQGKPHCLPTPNGAALALDRKGKTIILAAGGRSVASAIERCEQSIQYSLRIQSQL
jgi:hypothetical protein